MRAVTALASYGGRRRPAADSRAPRDRAEWTKAVLTNPQLPLPAKAVVVLVGTYMNWQGRAGVDAYPSLGRLEDDLGSQVGARALQKYLSAAVRLGLLVVTSDPSPGRACVYRAGVPTGEPAASAGTLPLDVLSPGDNLPSPARPCRCGRCITCTTAFEHLHAEVRTPARTFALSSPDPAEDPRTPLPPGDRPLLALVVDDDRGDNPDPPAGDLSAVPIPRHVELVAHGLVASIPDELGSRVVRRWERRVSVQVARLLAGGWSTDQLVEHVVKPSWQGVGNPGAVLVSRLQALEARPPRESEPAAWCGVCDPVDRWRENDEGRRFRCPACHPMAVAAAPF